ncbi:MAG: hypothetical protein A2284_15705 [Deltaproteobacteria bacterium RIFOXYA12_FULL_61_11]|nr:MAG: hypothetical protein A2284_15705 [Deltaproteobacteria bacterium RIFOXYA12_FULL_61_11]
MTPTGRTVKRRNLISALRRAGFLGPFTGGRYQFMLRGATTLVVPNPHHADIGHELLLRILKQAGISWSEWEQL